MIASTYIYYSMPQPQGFPPLALKKETQQDLRKTD